MFGAFFPAWMLCAFLGILGAAAAGLALRSPRLDVIPFPLAVCTACGVIVGVLVWTILFS